MSASQIKAGEAYIVISAKLDQLRADLNKGQQQIKSFGGAFKGVGGALLGPFGAAAATATATIAGIAAAAYTATNQVVAFGKAFADAGSVINDAAGRTGLSAKELQDLQFAAGQTGATLEDVERAARSLVKNGFNVNEFTTIGQQIAAIQDPSERASEALDVFGKSGTKLLPMFAEWQKLKAANAAVGPILTAQEVQRADELGDAFSALNEAVKRAGSAIGSQLAPELQKMLELMIGLSAEFSDFAKSKTGKGLGTLTLGALKAPGKAVEIAALSAIPFGGGRPIKEGLANARARGHAAVAGRSGIIGAGPDEFFGKTASDAIDKDLVALAARLKEVNKEFMERNSLAREFLTASERAADKEREIRNAIVDSNRSFAAGEITVEARNAQVRGLTEAIRRLRQQEMERLAKERPGLASTREDVAASVARIQRSASGTFSGAGAALLGRGGDPILRENKEQTVELRKIRKAVEATKTGPAFS